MRKRVFFYEYECDKCLRKIRKTQLDKKFCLPEGWDYIADSVDKVVYTYCDMCK